MIARFHDKLQKMKNLSNRGIEQGEERVKNYLNVRLYLIHIEN